ncbi:hypothetical protein ACVNS2_07920 [Paenibacillus caseinilyticus]|uniref:hypothetical protein n=1 Tax=Paenibacillus mucilaginosus TaxID=61624 RepID=UPI0013E8AB3F|nr:hypothetical protein [Paenibacillus mucilaginosus]
MSKNKEISKLYDRAGEWETKSHQAFARGDYDKAGEYRTKSLQLAARARELESKAK